MAGIAVVRVPIDAEADASEAAIRNLLALSADRFDDRVVFERKFGDVEGVTVRNVEKRRAGNPLLGILYNALFQVSLSVALLRERDRIDATLWHAGGATLLLPLVTSRLLGHRVFVCVLGRAVQGYLNDDYWAREGVGLAKFPLKYVFAGLVGTLETLSFLLSTRIVVFSERITDYLTLGWFAGKIRTVRFNYQAIPEVEPVESRTYPAIYLGRICELKGADRLAAAVPSLADDLDGPILFVGDGNMRAELESDLAAHDVEFTGWVRRDEAMELVADSKLFVLPSRSEGLPKALLEAMARGTVPVVTPVGDVPDVVSDDNGVVLDDPSPESLAETVRDLLEADLSERSSEAVETIRERFSYDAAKRDFESLVDDAGCPPGGRS